MNHKGYVSLFCGNERETIVSGLQVNNRFSDFHENDRGGTRDHGRTSGHFTPSAGAIGSNEVTISNFFKK